MRKLTLGIMADEISRDFRTAVRAGKQAGVERYEVRFLKGGRVPLGDPNEIAEVEAIAAGEGVTITAISPGLFKHATTPQDFQQQMREVFPAASELALRWKTRMITFGGKKPGASEANFPVLAGEIPAEIVAGMAEAAERAAKLGLDLLLEPEPISYTDTGIRAAEMVRRVGRPSLRMNYDPGNVAWFTRRDPSGEWPQIGDVVAHMHVKDLVLNPPDGKLTAWVVPGKGDIGYTSIFAGMKAAGFQGNISMESHLDMSSPKLLAEFKAALEGIWEQA